MPHAARGISRRRGPSATVVGYLLRTFLYPPVLLVLNPRYTLPTLWCIAGHSQPYHLVSMTANDGQTKDILVLHLYQGPVMWHVLLFKRCVRVDHSCAKTPRSLRCALPLKLDRSSTWHLFPPLIPQIPKVLHVVRSKYQVACTLAWPY